MTSLAEEPGPPDPAGVDSPHPAAGFEPGDVLKPSQSSGDARGSSPAAGGDDREGRVYVFHHPKIALAVRTAAATGRPLLVSGPSGCGKSTLAYSVARHFGARLYEAVVTSRTEARDLMYQVDAVARLGDAQVAAAAAGADAGAGGLRPYAAYREPGPLWWAFDRETARRRGVKPGSADDDPKRVPDAIDPNRGHPDGAWAVLLIDEIDKADVDLPNNLLVPLGSWQFPVDNAVPVAAARPRPLVVITTNGERELPAPFLRRCVTLHLRRLNGKQMASVANETFGPPEGRQQAQARDAFFLAVAGKVAEQQALAKADDRLLPPSTAEFLDILRACRQFQIHDVGDARFKALTELTLSKSLVADADGADDDEDAAAAAGGR